MARLTEAQRTRLIAVKGDREGFHSAYDTVMEQRLQELDPEFFEELQQLAEGESFWYA